MHQLPCDVHRAEAFAQPCQRKHVFLRRGRHSWHASVAGCVQQVRPHPADGLDQGAPADRFGEQVVERHAAHPSYLRAHADDRHAHAVFPPLFFADGVDQLPPPQPRHLVVGEYQHRMAVAPELQRLLAVAGNIHLQSQATQPPLHQQLLGRMVFCHQHARDSAAGDAGRREGWPGIAVDGRWIRHRMRQGQFHREHGSLARDAAQLQAAAHPVHQAAADAQPQPGPPVAPRSKGIGLRKRLEYRLLPLGRDTDASVMDLDPQQLDLHRVIDHMHLHRHVTVLGEFDRIADQVEQDLPQARAIDLQPARQAWVHPLAQFQSLAGGNGLQQLLHAVQHGAQVDRRGIQRHVGVFRGRQRQYVFQYPRQHHRGIFQRVQCRALMGVQFTATQHGHALQQRMHGAADAGSQGGDQAATPLHFRFGPCMRPCDGLFTRTLFGDIHPVAGPALLVGGSKRRPGVHRDATHAPHPLRGELQRHGADATHRAHQAGQHACPVRQADGGEDARGIRLELTRRSAEQLRRITGQQFQVDPPVALTSRLEDHHGQVVGYFVDAALQFPAQADLPAKLPVAIEMYQANCDKRQ